MDAASTTSALTNHLALETGASVEVLVGPHAGRQGSLVRSTGQGANLRWRVRLEGDGHCTWVEAVRPAGELASVASLPSCVAAGGDGRGEKENCHGKGKGKGKGSGKGGGKGGKHAAGPHAAAPWPVFLRKAEFKPCDEQRRAQQEAKMREKAELQQAELAERRARYAALQPADVHSVPWVEAREFSYVHGGSGGILLAELAGGSCAALKPQGKTATSEMLAQHLASACSVPVARCRVVRKGEAEHGEILDAAARCRLVGADEGAMRNTFFKIRVSEEKGVEGRGSDVFGILEYVPGHPLMGLEAQKALSSSPGSAPLLVGLGRLCAFDVLINNMDRIPMPVWQNDGNTGNVMVVDGERVVGIDQQVNAITQGPGQERYLGRVRDLVASVLPDAADSKTALGGLRPALLTNCGVELSDEQGELLLQGLREGFGAVTAAWQTGSLARSLEEADRVCADRFQYDAGRQWREVLYNSREVDDTKGFVLRVAQAIAEVVIDGSAA